MLLIELPRALEEYFAFAETEPTRRGRRFSITLPFFNGERLERLQWWYHVSPAMEQLHEGHGIAYFRAQAIGRFRRHIERWLQINGKRLHGDDPIPRVTAQRPAPLPLTALTAHSDEATPQPAHCAEIASWPLERIANG
jgi:hypothetical protein